MRVILQNRKSLLYFKASNQWTPFIHEASDFEGIIKAVDFISEVKLPGIDVLMHFGDPKYDVRLKVTN
ncbi:MAG: hypothetical protein JWQ71_932 [Pedosphaera sp.]|nr:hypothetical protein [Pedosphaera sp.]